MLLALLIVLQAGTVPEGTLSWVHWRLLWALSRLSQGDTAQSAHGSGATWAQPVLLAQLQLTPSESLCPPRGLILQDLTFVHLGNPDYIDGKVNFSKRWQQFNILDSMRCFQQA